MSQEGTSPLETKDERLLVQQLDGFGALLKEVC